MRVIVQQSQAEHRHIAGCGHLDRSGNPEALVKVVRDIPISCAFVVIDQAKRLRFRRDVRRPQRRCRLLIS